MKKWLFCLALFPALLSAQVVQFSGVVLSREASPQNIPNAYIQSLKNRQATLSAADGFFSLAALPGDSLRITRIGFEPETLYLSDTLRGKSYLVTVFMNWDTISLNEVTLYPWPSPEDLNRELLAMKVETTERDIALRNLAIQALKEKAAAMGADAGEITDYVMKSQAAYIANANRYYGENGASAILGRLTDPLAWVQLFEAFKRGDFKR